MLELSCLLFCGKQWTWCQTILGDRRKSTLAPGAWHFHGRLPGISESHGQMYQGLGSLGELLLSGMSGTTRIWHFPHVTHKCRVCLDFGCFPLVWSKDGVPLIVLYGLAGAVRTSVSLMVEAVELVEGWRGWVYMDLLPAWIYPPVKMSFLLLCAPFTEATWQSPKGRLVSVELVALSMAGKNIFISTCFLLILVLKCLCASAFSK